jgi:hypothetical protein
MATGSQHGDINNEPERTGTNGGDAGRNGGGADAGAGGRVDGGCATARASASGGGIRPMATPGWCIGCVASRERGARKAPVMARAQAELWRRGATGGEVFAGVQLAGCAGGCQSRDRASSRVAELELSIELGRGTGRAGRLDGGVRRAAISIGPATRGVESGAAQGDRADVAQGVVGVSRPAAEVAASFAPVYLPVGRHSANSSPIFFRASLDLVCAARDFFYSRRRTGLKPFKQIPVVQQAGSGGCEPTIRSPTRPNYASTALTTLPCTSVRRKSRP